MAKVKVSCRVENYDEPRKSSIMVHNHWNDSRMVELEINGERITVLGDNLKVAIDNCMNVSR